MAQYFVRERFFRPPEHLRRDSALPGALYNDLRRLLAGHRGGSLFVPIRTMQYLAVVEANEVIFVDSQGGYAHQDGEGGRLIRIAWGLPAAGGRDSLDGPVPCAIVYYAAGLEEVQRRLVGEIRPALATLLARRRSGEPQPVACRVIPLRRPG